MEKAESKSKRDKQRYNAHYRLRKKGFDVSAKDRTIFMESLLSDDTIPVTVQQLVRNFGYKVQLVIHYEYE